MVPSALQGYVKPKAFVKKVLRGKEPYQAIKRIGGIEAAKELFGYNELVLLSKRSCWASWRLGRK